MEYIFTSFSVPSTLFVQYATLSPTIAVNLDFDFDPATCNNVETIVRKSLDELFLLVFFIPFFLQSGFADNNDDFEVVIDSQCVIVGLSATINNNGVVFCTVDVPLGTNRNFGVIGVGNDGCSVILVQ